MSYVVTHGMSDVINNFLDRQFKQSVAIARIKQENADREYQAKQRGIEQIAGGATDLFTKPLDAWAQRNEQDRQQKMEMEQWKEKQDYLADQKQAEFDKTHERVPSAKQYADLTRITNELGGLDSFDNRLRPFETEQRKQELIQKRNKIMTEPWAFKKKEPSLQDRVSNLSATLPDGSIITPSEFRRYNDKADAMKLQASIVKDASSMYNDYAMANQGNPAMLTLQDYVQQYSALVSPQPQSQQPQGPVGGPTIQNAQGVPPMQVNPAPGGAGAPVIGPGGGGGMPTATAPPAVPPKLQRVQAAMAASQAAAVPPPPPPPPPEMPVTGPVGAGAAVGKQISKGLKSPTAKGIGKVAKFLYESNKPQWQKQQDQYKKAMSQWEAQQKANQEELDAAMEELLASLQEGQDMSPEMVQLWKQYKAMKNQSEAGK